jgi:hypothetical protein
MAALVSRPSGLVQIGQPHSLTVVAPNRSREHKRADCRKEPNLTVMELG